MILWMILTILCSAAAVMTAAPFLRTYGQTQALEAAEARVYRDQLDEIEREAVAGLIDENQAEGARAEIRRRLLLADRKFREVVHDTSLAANQPDRELGIVERYSRGARARWCAAGICPRPWARRAALVEDLIA